MNAEAGVASTIVIYDADIEVHRDYDDDVDGEILRQYDLLLLSLLLSLSLSSSIIYVYICQCLFFRLKE